MIYAMFQIVASMTGVVRALLSLGLIVGAGYFAWQGANWAWFWAALLVMPGIVAYVHASSLQWFSRALFGRDFRSEAYWRSIRSGLWLSGIGALAVLAYLIAWQ